MTSEVLLIPCFSETLNILLVYWILFKTMKKIKGDLFQECKGGSISADQCDTMH